MIDFNTTSNRINELVNQYWSNKKVMSTFETNTTTYKELYGKNKDIVVKLDELVKIY